MAKRVDIPAEHYWQANDGRKFPNEQKCLEYERLITKYHNDNRHQILIDGDDREQHMYYVQNAEEVYDVAQLSYYVYGYKPRIPDNFYCDNMWVWVTNDDDGYGPVPFISSLEAYITLQRDYLNDYYKALTDAERLQNTVWKA